VLIFLPLVWLGWEVIASAATIAPKLTVPTLEHFAACVGFFYLGLFALRGVRNPWPIWAGLALALAWTMHSALEQHFGGLAETMREVQSGEIKVSPELLQNPAYWLRVVSDRVFGTFMYPNALAAGILLLLPFTLVFIWQVVPKLRALVRAVFVAIVGVCGVACLYWSGSKAAWLFMVCVGVIGLYRANLPALWKRVLVYILILVGAAGFVFKYVDSASRGKRSMEARVVYWQAALKITRQHPFLGTGPGTFGEAFRPIRPEGAEPAKLAHNDYLEQASDSGVFGFLAFTAMILGLLFYLYRYRFPENGSFSAMNFAVWLGLLGLFLHSTMEFNLYYPAFGWPAFFLLGWLCGQKDMAV
jgi:O-antigen ligase